MSKTETVRQSAAASNERRIERLATQIEATRQAKHQSAESLAATLEPLAQAMAELTDQTRAALLDQAQTSRDQAAQWSTQQQTAAQAVTAAAAAAEQAAKALNAALKGLWLWMVAIGLLAGIGGGVLAAVLWTWLAPAPTIQNSLDAAAVAEHLKPAVIEALKPSKGK